MSIESNLKSIAESNLQIVELLKQSLGGTNVATSAAAPVSPVAPVASPAPVVPVVQPIPAVVAPVASPAPVVPVTTPSSVPFTDKTGLMQYVMNKYKELGPEKGAQIQNVLVGLGVSNINDVEPAQFAQFHVAVEGIV